jgi:hypothetical protein
LERFLTIMQWMRGKKKKKRFLKMRWFQGLERQDLEEEEEEARDS